MASAEERERVLRREIKKEGEREGKRVGKGHKDLLCSLLLLSFVEAKNGCVPLGTVSAISSVDKERERAILTHITHKHREQCAYQAMLKCEHTRAWQTFC